MGGSGPRGSGGDRTDRRGMRAPRVASVPLGHHKTMPQLEGTGGPLPLSPVGLIPRGLVTWLIQLLPLAFWRQLPPYSHGLDRGFSAGTLPDDGACDGHDATRMWQATLCSQRVFRNKSQPRVGRGL